MKNAGRNLIKSLTGLAAFAANSSNTTASPYASTPSVSSSTSPSAMMLGQYTPGPGPDDTLFLPAPLLISVILVEIFGVARAKKLLSMVGASYNIGSFNEAEEVLKKLADSDDVLNDIIEECAREMRI